MKTIDRIAKLDILHMVEELEEELHRPVPQSNFIDFALYWLENEAPKNVEVTTLASYERNVHTHIIPYFKPLKLKVSEVRPLHIKAFIDEKLRCGGLKNSEPLTGNSVQKYIANLKTMFDFAVMLELTDSNPARKVPLPKKADYEPVVYSIDELLVLWSALKGTDIQPGIFLASMYGWRRGEICGLKWEKIINAEELIRVDETRTVAKGEVVKKTKSRHSERDMPLLHLVSEYLDKLHASQQENREFFGDSYYDSGYVVCYPNGKEVSVSNFNKQFSKTLDRHGLRHIRIHDLRHSVAVFMRSVGVPMDDISAWLGHVDTRVDN